MRKHLVIITRRPGQETSIGNLGESARHALECTPGILNCRLLKATPGEAVLGFETAKQERPSSLDVTLSDRGIALAHAELCGWHH